MKTQFAPFYGQVHIARAYEIALTGGYRISLARFDRKNEKPVFTDKDPLIKSFIEMMGSHYATGSSIEERENCHMILEIAEISFEDMFSTRNQESIEDIRKNVKQTIKRHRPDDDEAVCIRPFEPYNIDETCVQLLKTAHSRLSFTPNDVKKILDVAYTIAAMESGHGDIKVNVQHIAEAIQYRCFDPENWS